MLYPIRDLRSPIYRSNWNSRYTHAKILLLYNACTIQDLPHTKKKTAHEWSRDIQLVYIYILCSLFLYIYSLLWAAHLPKVIYRYRWYTFDKILLLTKNNEFGRITSSVILYSLHLYLFFSRDLLDRWIVTHILYFNLKSRKTYRDRVFVAIRVLIK